MRYYAVVDEDTFSAGDLDEFVGNDGEKLIMKTVDGKHHFKYSGVMPQILVSKSAVELTFEQYLEQF